jgi:hypothetical protein
VRIYCAVGQDQLERRHLQRARPGAGGFRGRPLDETEERHLAEVELCNHWIHRRHRRQLGVGADEVAPVDVQEPNEPVDRCPDRGVAQVQLGLGHGGLCLLDPRARLLDPDLRRQRGVLHHRFLRGDVRRGRLFRRRVVVQLLLGDRLLRDQVAVPLHLFLRVHQRGLERRQLRPGLGERDLFERLSQIRLRRRQLRLRRLQRRHVRALVDDEQELALFDLRALLEQHLLQRPADLRAEVDGLFGDRLRHVVLVDRDGTGDRLRHDDSRGRRSGLSALGLRARTAPCEREARQRYAKGGHRAMAEAPGRQRGLAGGGSGRGAS